MPRRAVLLATRNPAKVRELRRLCATWDLRWRSLKTFPRAPHVREDGRTFRANAIKKAQVIARATRQIVLADDSGLEVDVLGGAPGVRSARYAGLRATDAANNRKLLRALVGIPSRQRGAQFRCVIAVADPEGRVATAQGVVRGRVSDRARGRTGFGYDPLFIIPRYRRTFAELGPRVKDRLSHRARAIRKARHVVQRFIQRAARA